MQKCLANFSVHTASDCLAVMGTYWMKIIFEYLKLPAILALMMCALYSPRGDEIGQVVCVPVPGKVMVSCI